MTNAHDLVSFPPSSDRRVLGLLRPAQVLWILSGTAICLLALTSCSLTSGVVVALATMAATSTLCLVRIDGEPIDQAALAMVWLKASTWPRRLHATRSTKPQLAYFVASVHHPDRLLEDVSSQWQMTASMGRALSGGAQAMKGEVQLLTVRRALVGRAIARSLEQAGTTHGFVTLLIARATPANRLHVDAMTQAMSDAGAVVGPVEVVDSPVVELGPIRRPLRSKCVTGHGEVAVSVLRSGPTLAVSPTSLVDLIIDPPWALCAVTICPTTSASLQRRIERRQTAALANAELLERRGFRRSAAQESQAARSADYEAAIARGERAALVYVHYACVENDAAALMRSHRALSSAGESCGLVLQPLTGRHHLGISLFGSPRELMA
jgi:hypothetical protein